jgi:Uma2 family endonuclease
MPAIQPWTVQQLERLPDDGNRYEVLDGELLVTPAPSDVHEAFLEWLDDALRPFVQRNGLGSIQRRGVVRHAGSHLAPDLIVRRRAPLRGWDHAPIPTLIIEVLSQGTRNRDVGPKRDFYMRTGIPEYWIVDREARAIIQIRGREEQAISSVLRWTPAETTASLEMDVGAMFTEIEARMGPAGL